MGEELFKLACNVGWLNLVDRDAKTDEEVYAFFHANFQEYFAALAIDDWDDFLPRKHDNNNPQPVPDKRYRIFEPHWKEVILLWLGREDIEKSEKEEFVNAMVDFKDGCLDKHLPHYLYFGDADTFINYEVVDLKKGFYGFRTYFITTAGIPEFKECDLVDEIVQQIVQWGFGKFNSETQKWEKFINQIERAAMEVLQETNRETAINALVELIYNQNVDNFTKYLAASRLWEIDTGNQIAINALFELISNQDVDDDTKYYAASSLGEIGTGNETAINALVELIN